MTNNVFFVLEDPDSLTFERYDSAIGWFEKERFQHLYGKPLEEGWFPFYSCFAD
jgi:hypothetical protein